MGRINLEGKRFDKLVVVQKTGTTAQDRYSNWLCECDCGNEVIASTKQLCRGTIKDCGCVPRKKTAMHGPIAEDLTGQSFGYLTVLERAESIKGRTAWKCVCNCGKEKVVASKQLKKGNVRSCGYCLRTHTKPLDLTGKQIGWLTVLYKLPERDYKRSIMWRCRCRCGTERDYSADSLLHGGIVSCGCYRRTIVSPSKGLHRLEGTCVELLLRKKARSDSKTGVVGVSPARNGKYKAQIGFQGKQYYLGTFNTIEEATLARKKGEEIHEDFLFWYYEEYLKENQ